MDKYTGKKLDRRYEIQEMIGVGGMATVYKAYDSIDDRTVAIKILKDEFSNNQEFIRRFKNESKAIAVLSHPNIVKVFDVSFGDVIQYIVMEFIDGITLKEYIEQQKLLSWKESVYFTTQILEAMQHAHDKGIIHRDVKPQNIMLLQDGTIKVTDFGIARFSNTETRTMTDKAIGSVHYIAPEQARGDRTDAKSDVYSIGVMLYEMLTGKLPFEADNAVSVAIMQLQSNPKPLRSINPDVPEGLEEITLKAMRKEPSMRYQSAEEMLKDIELFKENPSIKFEYEYLTDEDNTKYEKAINETKNAMQDDSDEEYNSEYLEEAEKKRSPAVNVIVGVVISFVLVAIVFVAMALFQSCESATGDAVDIPDLVGQKFSEVEKDSQYKFSWDVINSYDSEKEEGIILKQEPAASSKKIREDAVITLTVNSKDTLVAVPYVNGDPEETAIEKIKLKNLTPEVIYINDDDTPEKIVKDTSPKPGSEVAISETVKIFVKKKVEDTSVTIPDLSNMTRDEAAYAVQELGLEFDYKYNTEIDKPADSILGQSPMPGSVVEQGDTVMAYVAQGIEKIRILKMYTVLPLVDEEVYVRVTVDNVLVEEVSGMVNPTTTPKIYYDVKGSTTGTILVEINSVVYKEYTVDFVEKKVSLRTFPYQPVTEPVTETVTEPPVESEPPTEPYVDPNEPTQPVGY